MEAQEVFDTVVNHLVAQGRRAVVGRYCKYLVPETGARCAVGCLIPDGHPGLEFEGPVDSLLDVHRDLDLQFGPFRGLLFELQKVHDEADSWGPSGLSDVGLNALREVADQFGLSAAVVPGKGE